MTDLELTVGDRAALRQFLLGIKAFRKVAPELGIQTVHVFLEIALNEQLSGNSIIKKTGMRQSSCSRNIAVLSDRHWKGVPGLGLVENREDPFDQRRKLAALTTEGLRFARDLAHTLK